MRNTEFTVSIVTLGMTMETGAARRAGWLALQCETLDLLYVIVNPRDDNGDWPGPPARTGTAARQVTLHYTHITPRLHLDYTQLIHLITRQW